MCFDSERPFENLSSEAALILTYFSCFRKITTNSVRSLKTEVDLVELMLKESSRSGLSFNVEKVILMTALSA
jgi:hypothetical protein